MKKLVNYIGVNLSAILAFIAIVLFMVLIVSLIGNNSGNVDLTHVYDTMERRLKEQKQELTDSIQVYKDLIDKNQKEIVTLKDKIRLQGSEIAKIKKDYEDKRNHISTLDADGVVSESAKQLSE